MMYLAIDFRDEEATKLFHQIYLENYKTMYCVAFGILNNKEDAEDAVHAAFMSMADNFKEIKEIKEIDCITMPCVHAIPLIMEVPVNMCTWNAIPVRRPISLTGVQVETYT